MVGMENNEPQAKDLIEKVEKGDLPTKRALPKDYAGKLPDEFVQEWIKSQEEFVKAWKESEKFSLQLPHLVDLGWEEPFFGSLSRRISKTRSASIPTAGVRVFDGLIEMIWNPIFFAKVLTPIQVKGVLKHELYHVILEHITGRRQTPHALWNAATDLAINSLIPRRELPDFCLFPGEVYRPPNAPADWKPGLLAKIIKELPKEKSSEWYMSHFLDNEEIKQAMQRAREKARQKGQDQDGQGQGQGTPGAGAGGGGGNSQNEERSFNSELEKELYGDEGGQFDDHSVWDHLSDEQRDMMRDYVRDMFRDCVREAERQSTGWGTVPESIRAHLKKLLSKEVDWRELINNFVGKSKSTKTTSSIKRLNRRYPWEHPGRKRTYSARPALAFDQSGSMHDSWVELLFAEISNLGNLTEYDIIPFDHTVDEANIQNIRRGQQPKVVRTRQGGTSFDAPVQYVNKHHERWDALFLLTDGGCSAPSKCKIPMAWILAPGCELMFDPGDVPVIKMTDDRKNR